MVSALNRPQAACFAYTSVDGLSAAIKFGIMSRYGGRKLTKASLLAACTCSFVLILSVLTSVEASQGSLQLSLQGYGTVHGELDNAAIQPNGTVSMLMMVNDQLLTSQGTFPMTVSGVWMGTLNGSSVSGRIQDVAGVVHICIVMCQDADFGAVGTWSGVLNGAVGAGDFAGTVTFTSSPVSKIPVGQPIPVTGTWTTAFELPMPELSWGGWGYTLVLALILSALALAGYRRVHV